RSSGIDELAQPPLAAGESLEGLLADRSTFEDFDADAAGERNYGFVRLQQLAMQHLLGFRACLGGLPLPTRWASAPGSVARRGRGAHAVPSPAGPGPWSARARGRPGAVVAPAPIEVCEVVVIRS